MRGGGRRRRKRRRMRGGEEGAGRGISSHSLVPRLYLCVEESHCNKATLALEIIHQL